MAASSLPLLLSFLFLIPFSISMLLPLTKDASTLQYLTHLHKGIPGVPIKLLLDLGAPFIWIDHSSSCLSSSHRPIHCGSIQCSMAKITDCGGGGGGGNPNFNNPQICGLYPDNPLTRVASRAELAEDVASIGSDPGSITTVDAFLFSCAPSLLLKGLPSGAKGVLGLGRSKFSLPSQLASNLGFSRKFAVCLSSSGGVVLSGDHYLTSEESKSLTYTPIVTNYQGNSGTLEEYYITVKSIKINGKRLSIDPSLLSIDEQRGDGGTKLSTVVPYTTMQSTIYDTFTRAFINFASFANMTMAAPVAPFGVCFRSDEGMVVVPTIDLVLQSEMVKWRIEGRNSMVKVSDEVMCLGFVDGGLSPRASIVIGGFQLEDNLVEFDLGTSMLGFSSSSSSSSLRRRQISCSSGFGLSSSSSTTESI